MNDRRKMGFGDWLNGAAILVVGIFLGLALYYMALLVGTSFWPLIIIIPVLFGGLFLITLFFDGTIDRIFPSGVKPAPRGHAKERKPLALLLSLPIGVVIGMIGALFGLGEFLL